MAEIKLRKLTAAVLLVSSRFKLLNSLLYSTIFGLLSDSDYNTKSEPLPLSILVTTLNAFLLYLRIKQIHFSRYLT